MVRRMLFGLICVSVVATFVQAQPAGLSFYDNLSQLAWIYPNVESH